MLEHYTALWDSFDMAARSFFKLTSGALRMWLNRKISESKSDPDGECYEPVYQMAINLWRDYVFLKLVSSKGSNMV